MTSTNDASCATPDSGPTGSPHTRETTHTPMKATLEMQAIRMTRRDGRVSTAAARPIWTHPARANPMPSGIHSCAWDGTITRWIAPAAAKSVASSTRTGWLHSCGAALGPTRS